MRYRLCLGLLLFGCQMPNPAFGGVDDGDTAEADTRASGDGDGDSSAEASTTNSDASSSSDAESDTSSGVTDTSDTGPDCSNSLDPCNGDCVDTKTDPLNCGECNFACDDGQLCSNGDCLHIKRVFATSVPFAANLQGLVAADYNCNASAQGVALPGTYKAWLSTPNSWPDQVFSKAGIYVRLDDVVVAEDWEDLTDGTLQAPISITEFGMPVVSSAACNAQAAVWTATTPNGASAGAPNCNGWATADQSATGQVGDAHAIDGAWSLVGGCQVSCSAPLSIYCIEQ